MIEFPVVRIFTFKDGLLSRFAHDLQLALTRFEVGLKNYKITGCFHTDSVVVEGAVRDGKLDPRALSASDCQKILRTIREEVLQSDRYPEACLEAAVQRTQGGTRLDGTLKLMGRRLALPPVEPVHVGTAWIAEFPLQPSRWGIRPYRAMGGTLKIKDKIRIEVALPAAEDWEYEGAERQWKMNAGDAAAEEH